MRTGIAQSRPELGGLVSSMSPSVIIAPANANRPYIMGSVVAGLNPTPTKQSVKAFVGQPAGQQEIQGVMCLNVAQIKQRGGQDGFVKSGFAEDYNNIGTKGAFWCALDLAHFDRTAVEALQGNGILSVDGNGVLSFGATAVQGNTSAGAAANNTPIEPHSASVFNFYDSAIIGAIDEVVSVGNTTYTFKYPQGIGAILVVIR